MGPKKFAFGVTFQKHADETNPQCCTRANIVICDNIAQAGQWAADNCPKEPGWTASVAQIQQPIIVI